MQQLLSLIVRLILITAIGLAVAGLALFAIRFPGIVVIVVVLRLFVPPMWRGGGYDKGTARLATLGELAANGLLSRSRNAVILGRTGYTASPTRGEALHALFSPGCPGWVAVRVFLAAFRKHGGKPLLIRLERFQMLATFAGTGRGKGVGIVIPNALACALSMVILDIKAEVFKITSGHRRERLGHVVLVLDPMGLSGQKSESLNPLDFINANDPDFLDQSRDLADALILVKGTETDPHWNAAAALVLCAMIAYVCACESKAEFRTLRSVRKIVSSRRRYIQAVKQMQLETGFSGVVRELGFQLTWFRGKELSSVLTTVQQNTQWMDSPAVAAVMGPSTFHPNDLRTKKLTLYLILPPERLSSLAGLMRLWINTLLRVTTRGVPSEENKILFLLDEIGHCGKLQSLEDAVTLMRGYGIRLWFIFQSVGQVKKLFGEQAETVLDNLETQQYFGISSMESAEAVSKRAGESTIVVESMNESRSTSSPHRGTLEGGQSSQSAGFDRREQGRALVRPDEVIRLGDDMALTFHRNMHVIPVQVVRYYSDPAFRNGRTGCQTGTNVADLLFAILVLLGSTCIGAIGFVRPDPAVVRRLPSPYGVPSVRPLAPMPYGTTGGIPPVQTYRPASRPKPSSLGAQ